MRETIRFRLNGREASLDVDGDRRVLWVLRADLGLTGAKFGCGEGLCGACTVLVDGRAVKSCRLRVRDLQNAEVTTIEGLAPKGGLHPLQEEFAERGALQCGFCTSGMILRAHGFLGRNPDPSRAEIVSALDGNLCRCGAHKRIVEAVESAARRQGGRP